MKINNNFLMYCNSNYLQKTTFKSKYKNENKCDVSYFDVHKVLNDPLVLDSIAVELAKVVAQAKSGNFKPTKVEDFRDNILNLLAFNKKANSFSEDFSRQSSFDSRTMLNVQRFSYEDYFQRQPKTEETYTQLDRRLDGFSRYHKVDSKLVLPELKNAFANLSPEIFETLPDGLISNILKECSCDYEDGKVFLNEDMSLEEKLRYLDEIKERMSRQQTRGNSSVKNKKNDPKLLQSRIQKILLAKNIMFNLSRIEYEFNASELELLFAKSEKGRYLKPRAIGNFQAWLSEVPFEREYYKKLSDLKMMVY